MSLPFDIICIICETEIKGNKSKLQDNGWNNFKIQAKRWQEITIPSGDSKYIYTKLYDKIKNFDWAQEFVHLSYRTNLRTKVDIYAKRYAEMEGDSESGMGISLNENTSSKMSVKGKSIDKEKLCFVCQEKRKSGNFPLNQVGLGRCTEERAGNRIKERTSIFLKDEDSRFHNAAIKLNILLAGSHDIYAAGVYYHQSCYLKYAVNKIAGNAESNEYEETLSVNILDDFVSKVERCIIFQKSAFLLCNLLKELIKL